MTACDHPVDGHANHGPWCQEPARIEAGPGLGLVIARQRLTRAVLATLIGPTDLTSSYGGSEKAAADYAEMTEAARALIAAQEAWDAAVEARHRDRIAVRAEQPR